MFSAPREPALHEAWGGSQDTLERLIFLNFGGVRVPPVEAEEQGREAALVISS